MNAYDLAEKMGIDVECLAGVTFEEVTAAAEWVDSICPDQEPFTVEEISAVATLAQQLKGT